MKRKILMSVALALVMAAGSPALADRDDKGKGSGGKSWDGDRGRGSDDRGGHDRGGHDRGGRDRGGHDRGDRVIIQDRSHSKVQIHEHNKTVIQRNTTIVMPRREVVVVPSYYGGERVVYRAGGPPPWAPAWGHRRKFKDDSYITSYAPPFDIGLGRCNREAIGGILGGVGGGLLGSQIGEGTGKTIATAGGVIVGYMIGGSIGRSMDQADHACVAQALEYGPVGRPVSWRNPDNGYGYQFAPVRTFDRGGQYCREYTTIVDIGGRREQAYGTACRAPDGAWEVVK